MQCDSYLSLIKTLELIKKKCKSGQALLSLLCKESKHKIHVNLCLQNFQKKLSARHCSLLRACKWFEPDPILCHTQ